MGAWLGVELRDALGYALGDALGTWVGPALGNADGLADGWELFLLLLHIPCDSLVIA